VRWRGDERKRLRGTISCTSSLTHAHAITELKLQGRYEEVVHAKTILEQLVASEAMCTNAAFGNMVSRSSASSSSSFSGKAAIGEGFKGIYWPPVQQLKDLKAAGATFVGVAMQIQASPEEVCMFALCSLLLLLPSAHRTQTHTYTCRFKDSSAL
jgi:hypothetical protein